MSIPYQIVKTPVGKMRIAATSEGICIFDFASRPMMPNIISRVEQTLDERLEEGEHRLFPELLRQIDEYFKGERKTFDIPLHLVGSDFQVAVWKALLEIPYGETRSYKQQSVLLGNEKAIRAVARANGENSIAIIVPCHRIIGSNGELTGYGGGLPKKKWLLDHEWKHSGKHHQLAIGFG